MSTQCIPDAPPTGLDACNVGDEGGFAPNIADNEEGLKLLQGAIAKAGCVSSWLPGLRWLLLAAWCCFSCFQSPWLH